MTTIEAPKSLAQTGYEGYAVHTCNEAPDGGVIPNWVDAPQIHGSWNAGVMAILRAAIPAHLLPPETLERHASDAQVADSQAEHRQFWEGIIRNPDGSLNEDQVHAELADYGHLIREVPKVYDAITGGMLSKPNYFAHAVIGVYEDQRNRDIDDAVLEVLADLYRDLEDEDVRELIMLAAQPHGDLLAEVQHQVHIAQLVAAHVSSAP
ncbi:hypothetical protein GCM10022631_10900 [Deinococcus rubellus]|uniref:hypothetical protein n=1 Tax=Deinococcus rubellus TaxID=1889240 RepID=UPI0031E92B32